MKVTEEMIAAFNGADYSGTGNADWEDAHVRIGLRAVLDSIHPMTPEERAVIDAAKGYVYNDTEAHHFNELFAAVMAFEASEREQGEMSNFGAEDAVRNAERQGRRAGEAHRNRMTDANTAAQGSRVTLDELKSRRRS